MKKILALLLVTIMAAGFVAGCSGPGGGETSSTPGSGASSTPGGEASGGSGANSGTNSGTSSGSPSPTAGSSSAANSGSGASASPGGATGDSGAAVNPNLVPYRDNVNLVLGQSPDTLDPHLYNNAAAGVVCDQIFDTLYWVSPMHGEHPRLATSYDVSPDGLTYTYHLRPGVVFSDGSPLTANDVVFSWGRLRPSPTTAAVREVVALDDLTVEFRLNNVVATFHTSVSLVYIASESAMTAAGSDAGMRPIGTGGFVLDLDTFAIDQHITLLRNPLHWNYDEIQIQSATLFVITDVLTQYNAFEAGNVDMFVSDANYWPGIQESGLYNTVWGPIGLTTFITFNTEVAPWNDVRVRQAFSYAVDNDLVVALAAGGIAVSAYSAAPPGVIVGAALPDEPYYYNPEKARQLFADAGVTDLGPIMTVAGFTELILQIIQQNLNDIGISMTIDILDALALTAARNTGNFTASTLGVYYIGEFDQYAGMLASDGPLNLGRMQNPRVDELFSAAIATTDNEARFAIYRQIINLVNEDARNFYILHSIFTHAYHARLTQEGWEDGNIYLRRFAWDLVEP